MPNDINGLYQLPDTYILMQDVIVYFVTTQLAFYYQGRNFTLLTDHSLLWVFIMPHWCFDNTLNFDIYTHARCHSILCEYPISIVLQRTKCHLVNRSLLVMSFYHVTFMLWQHLKLWHYLDAERTWLYCDQLGYKILCFSHFSPSL